MSEPLIMHVAPPTPAPRLSEPEQPSFAALAGTLFAAADTLIIGGTMMPGLLICVPGILLVVVPLMALGLLALLAVAALLVPVGVVLGAVAAARAVVRLARPWAPAQSGPRPRGALAERVLTADGSADLHA